jgi:hypothetical protein
VHSPLVEAGARNRQLSQERTHLREIVWTARSAVAQKHAGRAVTIHVDREACAGRLDERRSGDH